MNGVRLISNKERFVVKYGTAKFFYRRITNTAWKSYMQKHTVKGQVDLTAALTNILEDYIIDWSGILDENDKVVEFDQKLVANLPDPVQSAIIDVIKAANGNTEKDLEKVDETEKK